MTRAYLRLDPAFDEHKESYPDGPYAALIATLCLAESQPDRGRFRSLDYLRRLLGKRGRHATFLLDRGDIVELPDKRVYVDGWDEWQEGDWKVTERVQRIRSRKHAAVVTPEVTAPVTLDVTVPVTVARQSVAVSGKQSASGAADRSAAGALAGIDPFYDGLPHLDEQTVGDGDALIGKGKPFRYQSDKVHTEFDRLLEAHGADRVRSVLQVAGRRAPNQPPTWVQLVYGTRDILEPIRGNGRVDKREIERKLENEAADRLLERKKHEAKVGAK